MDLEDLDKEFDKIIKEFPQARRKLVEKCGEKMYREVINDITSSVKERSGNLKAGVTKVIGSKGGYCAIKPNFSKAPHTHLIENGRKIVKDGKVVGWINGKHMYRNALNKLITELEEDAEKMLDELVGDLGG